MTDPTNPPILSPGAAKTSERRSLVAVFNELLGEPTASLRHACQDGPSARRLFAGALAGAVLYGAVAGCFQGGTQMLVTAIKAPLILFGALALCLPSFFVLGAVAGVNWSGAKLLGTLSGLAATLGLLLVGLLPITWLFSVSSRQLAFVTWIHVFAWGLALAFALRYLRMALPESGGMLPLWLALFALVSLQMATLLRPVLLREAGAPIFASERLFFIEHFARIHDHSGSR
ncbi:MAG TPA: hypothetical protein VJU18_16630 [Vicinamibacteria bacterium]|nr:hypothetical protein [Vicinamibacteria bacterium]